MSEQQGQPRPKCVVCCEEVPVEDLVYVWDEAELYGDVVAFPEAAHGSCVNEDDVIHVGILHYCSICGDPVLGTDSMEDHMKCLMDRVETQPAEDSLVGYFCEGGPIGG